MTDVNLKLSSKCRTMVLNYITFYFFYWMRSNTFRNLILIFGVSCFQTQKGWTYYSLKISVAISRKVPPGAIIFIITSSLFLILFTLRSITLLLFVRLQKYISVFENKPLSRLVRLFQQFSTHCLYQLPLDHHIHF